MMGLSAADTGKPKPAVLALADGTVFRGKAFGAQRNETNPALGEVVFNTSMFGYQEILTDPSYAGQMLCFTYPHIGNVGCNAEDNESSKLHATGCIIRDLSPLESNFRSQSSLSRYLEEAGVMGLYEIDTRMLVNHLRDNGAQMGAMACGEQVNVDALVAHARAQGSMEGKDYVKAVSCEKAYTWNELPWSLERYAESLKAQSHGGWGGRGGTSAGVGYAVVEEEKLASRPHVVALDCGVKRNILRLLVEVGFRVTVLPATSSSAQVLSFSPDALFLSNGPGDPATLGYIVSTVQELVGKIPTFGICLGHQILGQVFGGKTFKLKFGHRGGNHPVKDLSTGKVEITVQNHGFAVEGTSVSSEVKVSHLNLNDGTVEGLDAPGYKAFSVQYHPEASPGPHDSSYLFRRFFEMVVKG